MLIDGYMDKIDKLEDATSVIKLITGNLSYSFKELKEVFDCLKDKINELKEVNENKLKKLYEEKNELEKELLDKEERLEELKNNFFNSTHDELLEYRELKKKDDRFDELEDIIFGIEKEQVKLEELEDLKIECNKFEF